MPREGGSSVASWHRGNDCRSSDGDECVCAGVACQCSAGSGVVQWLLLLSSVAVQTIRCVVQQEAKAEHTFSRATFALRRSRAFSFPLSFRAQASKMNAKEVDCDSLRRLS